MILACSMIQNALPQCDWWTTIHKHVSSFFCNFFLLKVPALLQGIYSEGSKVGCNLPESSCLQPVRPFDCSKENQGNRLSTYWRLCFLLDSSCVRTNALRLRFAKRELNTTINQSASKKSPSVPCHSMSFHVIPCLMSYDVPCQILPSLEAPSSNKCPRVTADWTWPGHHSGKCYEFHSMLYLNHLKSS